MAERKCIVSQCCCCCTLKTGALTIGILDLIGALIQCISVAYTAISSGQHSLWFNFIIALLLALTACFLLNGIRTSTPKQVWLWVYVTGVLAVILLISGLVVFFQYWDAGILIGSIIGFALYIYCIIVVRSFAFELESGGGGPNV